MNNKYIEMMINSIDDDHIQHHHGRKVDVTLNCQLIGKLKIYNKGKTVKAYIEKLGKNCHVLEIQGESFGVFSEYYKVEG